MGFDSSKLSNLKIDSDHEELVNNTSDKVNRKRCNEPASIVVYTFGYWMAEPEKK